MTEILIVCTANRCRSPMAQALLGKELGARSPDWNVSSAGLMPSGSPVVDEAAEVMREDFGLDLAEHRSRRVTPFLVDNVDLILCMERRHVREILVQDRTAFARMFTVREFIRQAKAVPSDETMSFDQWIRLLSAGRTTQSLASLPDEDDIMDPIGRPLGVFRETAKEIAGAMSQVAALLANSPG